MATVTFTPQAPAVAQVATVQITAYDAATTYKLTVGGVVVSTVGTGGTVNTTATALAAAWNASTHPYFTGVTASAATDTVTLTADTAGVPFTATSSVTSGTGTIGSVTVTTANAGPNVLAAANMSGGALPGNGDTLIFENSSTDVLWSLDALTSVTTLTVIVRPTFTGKIGLDDRKFQLTASTQSSSYPEYREDELTFDGATLVWLPVHTGIGVANGSGRVKINTKASAATLRIEQTARQASETGMMPVRIRGTAIGTATIQGQSFVGLADNAPADAATITTLTIGGNATVHASSGVTLTTANISGGELRLDAAATTINHDGGDVITAGSGAITTWNQRGGNSWPESSGTITTLNGYAGTCYLDGSQVARTITNFAVNPQSNFSFSIDRDVVTLTNNIALSTSTKVSKFTAFAA